ncbi:hypothetical protein JCM19239_3859 [Vibrio variabilis]|uniref:Uncharacterized protein n=1 Tax=Vibrio variabilis TaxID=990271 RepID=A0ABQ0J627_9VIBR|nr:hypothetical protein JCM19239_3859 [Vibrio variabilis]
MHYRSLCHLPWEKLPEVYREQILYAQENYRNIGFDDLISVMSVSEIHVVVALHNNAMVGHIVYGKDGSGQDCYLAISPSIKRCIVRFTAMLARCLKARKC